QAHPEQGQVLVFGDDQSVFPRLEPNQCYRPDSGQPQQVPVIQRFAEGLESRSDTLTLHAYDDQQPCLPLHGSAWAGEAATPSAELYDYPGRFTERTRGRQLARRALEAVRRDRRRAEGAATGAAPRAPAPSRCSPAASSSSSWAIRARPATSCGCSARCATRATSRRCWRPSPRWLLSRENASPATATSSSPRPGTAPTGC